MSMGRNVFNRRVSRGGVYNSSSSPSPTPTPTPAPIAANIFNNTDVQNFFANSSGGEVGAMAPGTYNNCQVSAVKNLSGNPITLRAADFADPPTFAGTGGTYPTGSGFDIGRYQGVIYDGLEFVHDGLSSGNGSAAFNCYVGGGLTTSALTFRRCLFEMQLDTNAGFGLKMQTIADDILVEMCRIKGGARGMNFMNAATDLTIQLNHFYQVRSDAINTAADSARILVNLNLFEDFSPAALDHPDIYQTLGAHDQVTFSNNCATALDADSEPQGFYIDTNAAGTRTNFTVTGNQLLGIHVNAILMGVGLSGGTNTVANNTLRARSGSAWLPTIHLENNSGITYSSNVTAAAITGAGSATNGGGNTINATGLSVGDIQTLQAAFRAANRTIPTAT